MDKKKKVIVGTAAAACFICVGAAIWYQNAVKISVKENIVLEFGESVPDDVEDYAELGRSVKDTRKPEIKLKASEFDAVAGQELNAADLIEEVTDLSGIHSVTFKDHVAEQDVIIINEAGIPDLRLKYDEEGAFENTIIAEDNNGMEQQVNFTVNVRADYTAHVQGIADITLEQGQTHDWMWGITYDERI